MDEDRQVQAREQANALLCRLHDYAPTSSQVIGFITLLVSGAILLALAGFSITAALITLIFVGPVAIITAPVWIPAAFILFLTSAGVLSACGFGVAVIASAAWLYRYFSGRHPMGSDQVDYARNRIADTASHMKDYAREYGGYLQSRIKDAAPGA